MSRAYHKSTDIETDIARSLYKHSPLRRERDQRMTFIRAL